jgi:hypothetical protein
MASPRTLQEILGFATSAPRPVRFWLGLVSAADFQWVRQLEQLEDTVIGVIWRRPGSLDVMLADAAGPRALGHILVAAVADLYGNLDTPVRCVATYHASPPDREWLEYDAATLDDLAPGIRCGAQILLAPQGCPKEGEQDLVPTAATLALFGVRFDPCQSFAESLLEVLRGIPVLRTRIGDRDVSAHILLEDRATVLHCVACFLRVVSEEGD